MYMYVHTNVIHNFSRSEGISQLLELIASMCVHYVALKCYSHCRLYKQFKKYFTRDLDKFYLISFKVSHI